MKCLVTGGAGFIGSNLVNRLIDDGYDVSIIDDLSTGKEENINPKARFIQGDISNTITENFSFLKDVDVVFHLAAKARVQPSIENPIEFNKVNVGGLLNVLNACVKYKVKRFVYSSSSSVYGNVKQLPTPEEHELNPMSPYALQKLIGEQYCKLYNELHGLETVCLRYFNVYGNGMSLEGAYKLVIPIFIEQILNNKPMTVRGDGEQRRDFTYIGDVVDANILAATLPYPPETVFNIGNGDNRSVNQLADMIGEDHPKEHIDPVIEPKETLADNSLAEYLLGWSPKGNLEEWIKTYKEEMGL